MSVTETVSVAVTLAPTGGVPVTTTVLTRGPGRSPSVTVYVRTPVVPSSSARVTAPRSSPQCVVHGHDTTQGHDTGVGHVVGVCYGLAGRSRGWINHLADGKIRASVAEHQVAADDDFAARIGGHVDFPVVAGHTVQARDGVEGRAVENHGADPRPIQVKGTGSVEPKNANWGSATVSTKPPSASKARARQRETVRPEGVAPNSSGRTKLKASCVTAKLSL